MAQMLTIRRGATWTRGDCPECPGTGYRKKKLCRRLVDLRKKGPLTIEYSYAQLQCEACKCIFHHEKAIEELDALAAGRYTRRVVDEALRMHAEGKSSREIEDRFLLDWRILVSHTIVQKWIRRPNLYATRRSNSNVEHGSAQKR